MKIKKVLSFASFLIVLLLPALSALAYDAPRIYIKELNIRESSFNAGDTLSGDFLMWNTAKETMAGLDYKISLEQNHNVYGEEVNSVSGQISPDKTLSQKFSYTIPRSIPTGDYTFRVQLFSQSGMALNWSEKDISIKGLSEYLVIGDASVVKNGESKQPLIGVGFKIDEIPKIKFLASNPSSQKIEFKPSVAVYWFQANMDKLDDFFGEPQVLEAGESKEIELAMPKYQKPGSYLAKVVLSNKNADISNTESFRWVVAGDGARILNVKIDSNFLQTGKEVKIIVEFVGPADASEAGEAALSLNISGQDGKIIFSQERTVRLGKEVNSETFNFMPESDAANPKIEAKIVKGGNELGAYSVQIKSPGYENEINNQNPPIQSKSYLIPILIGLAILLIIAFIMIKILSKNKNLFLIIIAISAGLLLGGAGEVKAATTSWNGPVRDTAYGLADSVNFTGNLNISGCDNGADYIAKAYACDINYANCIYMGEKYNYNLDPTDIAYDAGREKIYIPDYEGHRIVQINANTKQIENIWGTYGDAAAGIGKFNGVYGIFYDSVDDLIYVADRHNNRIVRFDPDNMAGTWKTYNNAGDSLSEPRGVFVDHQSGKTIIYVADSEKSRVVRFEAKNNGTIEAGTWKTYGVADPVIGPPGNSGIGQFHAWESPTSIFYDKSSEDSGPGSGYIYAADKYNDRIVRFKLNVATGAYVVGSWKEFKISPTGSGKKIINPIRASYYQGWVYVVEYSNKIVRFKPDDAGQDFQILGSSPGSGEGQFFYPYGIVYDENSEDSGPGSGYIYTASIGDKSIEKFKLEASGAVKGGTWEDFDFWTSRGYDFSFDLPASFPPGFAFGDGVSEPLGAAYAKIAYEVVDTDPDSQNITSTTVEITGGGGSGASATAIVSGAVSYISPLNKGSGYTLANVVISPPGGGGIQAVVTANVAAWGEITSFNISNPGSGYTSSPTVTITGDGLGASAMVSIVSGAVTSITLDGPGSGYTSFPTVTIKGAGTGATATANIAGGKVVSITKNNSGSGYNFAVESSERIIINSSGSAPTISDISFQAPLSYCGSSPLSYTFKWKFNDSGDTESKYQIEIDNNNNFSSPTVNRQFSGLFNPSGTYNEQIVVLGTAPDLPNADKLAYGETYYWRVEVWDNANNTSGPQSGGSFATEPHTWPTVGFAPPPPANAAVVNIPTTFKATGNGAPNDSVCYGSGNPCKKYEWDFCAAGNCTIDRLGAGETVSHTYITQDNFDVVLTVTDKDDYVCSNALSPKTLGAKPANWKEVIPR